MAKTMANRGPRNARRRRRIEKLRAQGMSHSEIANKLGVAVGTVTYYVKTSNPTQALQSPKRKYVKRSPQPSMAVFDVSKLNSILDAAWKELSMDNKITALEALVQKGNE